MRRRFPGAEPHGRRRTERAGSVKDPARSTTTTSTTTTRRRNCRRRSAVRRRQLNGDAPLSGASPLKVPPHVILNAVKDPRAKHTTAQPSLGHAAFVVAVIASPWDQSACGRCALASLRAGILRKLRMTCNGAVSPRRSTQHDGSRAAQRRHPPSPMRRLRPASLVPDQPARGFPC